MRRYSLSLGAEEWLLIGYLAGLALWCLAEALQSDTPTDTRSWTRQELTLTEEHLQRLEDGETVAVHRWHGHELVLGGSMVLDAEKLGGEEGDR